MSFEGTKRERIGVINILHIDDEVMCAALVEEWVRRSPKVQYAAWAPSLSTGMQYLRKGGVDLVLLDVNLPDGDGLSHVRTFQEVECRPSVMLFTDRLDPEFLERSRKVSVAGVLHKSGRKNEFDAAIEACRTGRQYYSPTYASAMRTFLQDPTAFYKILSEKEQTLIRLFGVGLSDREVTKRTCLAWGTVRAHRRNIMKKLSLHRSHAIVAWARSNGFVN